VSPHVVGSTLTDWQIRNPNLRWPVELPGSLRGARVLSVTRRAKYLQLGFQEGALIIHLGMSGSLRIITDPIEPPRKHDHVDLLFAGNKVLRLNDPRRFGSMHWQPHPVMEHWLLSALGPEPLGKDFTGSYLKSRARKRRVAVKNLIMDSHVVVGVGNIYANEALFLAGLRPTLRASRITQKGYSRLVAAIQRVLGDAIEMGGTTLRDFVNQDGNPGYFKQSLNVYGRERQPCRVCGSSLRGARIGQRATVYCPSCQSSQGFSGRAWDGA
jgi:formamidopyrimidine-DNA glycosylase